MAEENILSGEERIASELKRRPGIRVAPSPMPKSLGRGSRPAQDPPRGDWPSFELSSDRASVFFTVVTVRIRILYTFVVPELGRQNWYARCTTRPRLSLVKGSPEPRPAQSPDLGRVVAIAQVGRIYIVVTSLVPA
jgi:hypothetical protein